MDITDWFGIMTWWLETVVSPWVIVSVNFGRAWKPNEQSFQYEFFACHFLLYNDDLKRIWNTYNFNFWTIHLSEWLYNMGQNSSKFSTGQFPVWSQNQCYIFRWSLWHNKFWAVTKTEAVGVILSFRGWISLYRASRQSVLFFTRYAE